MVLTKTDKYLTVRVRIFTGCLQRYLLKVDFMTFHSYKPPAPAKNKSVFTQKLFGRFF